MKVIEAKPEAIETLSCERHGSYEPKIAPYPLSNKFMVFDACPKCSEEENERKIAADELEAKEIAHRRVVSEKTEAGLNKRHIECTFRNYKTDTTNKELALTKAKSYMTAILKGSGSCLVMAGKVGTGKTHLAAAMINIMVEKGRTCQLVKMSELIRNLKSTWSRSSEKSEAQLIDYYSKVSLLIIDEIGIQFGSDTEKLLLSEVIDNRYQDVLPTVLISNLDTDGIKGCIGDRSYDRLRQDGGKVIAFDWESERGK